MCLVSGFVVFSMHPYHLYVRMFSLYLMIICVQFWNLIYQISEPPNRSLLITLTQHGEQDSNNIERADARAYTIRCSAILSRISGDNWHSVCLLRRMPLIHEYADQKKNERRKNGHHHNAKSTTGQHTIPKCVPSKQRSPAQHVIVHFGPGAVLFGGHCSAGHRHKDHHIDSARFRYATPIRTVYCALQ